MGARTKTRVSRRCVFAAALLLGGLTCPSSGAGKTLVFPHLLEQSGLTSSTADTFDTELLVSYGAGLGGLGNGNGAQVDLYLYDANTGRALRANGGRLVCHPCRLALDRAHPSLRLTLDDLVRAAGGFPTATRLDLALIVRTSGDVDRVAIAATIAHSEAGPQEVSLFGAPSFEQGASANTATSLLVSGIEETPGRADTFPFCIDTELRFFYARGIGGGTPSSFRADVYLYQANGSLLRSLTGKPICNPCKVKLDRNRRAGRLVLEDLVLAGGGFPAGGTLRGTGVVRVRGDALGGIPYLGRLYRSQETKRELLVLITPTIVIEE